MKKKKKKPNKKTIRIKLDRLWSELIRRKGQCEMCPITTGLNAHHIVGRRNLHLRWDLRNGVCLCPGCHVFRKNSAHQNPVFFTDWLDAARLSDLEYLRKQQNELETSFNYELCLSELEDKKKLYL